METFRQAFLDTDIISQAWPILLQGLYQTVLLSALVLPLGLLAGLALALAGQGERWLRVPAALAVDLFRSLPPLVLLILLYAGLPFAGIDLGAWGSVALCFLLNTGAYHCEVLRSGIEAVPRGQVDAARALGMLRWQVMAFVIMPQALRKVLPDLLSNVLEVVKMTSLASAAALPELLFMARQAQSATYNASPLLAAAALYFLLLWPLVRYLSILEDQRAQKAGGR
jgi:polar amino acid transport system permease protein